MMSEKDRKGGLLYLANFQRQEIIAFDEFYDQLSSIRNIT
jgi:hypothetical protein